MHLINQKPLDTAPLLCSDCGQLKRQFYVLGIKSLICVDCATGIARDFEPAFDAIFNAPSDPQPVDPQPVNAVKYGEFLTLNTGAKNPTVYERGNYCRSRRKFELIRADDFNRRTFVKPSTLVRVIDH